MSEQPKVEVHDIVQIKPEHDRRFGACLMVVTEVKSWGVQGYVRGPGDPAGDYYYRAQWNAFEPTGGRAVFVHDEGEPACPPSPPPSHPCRNAPRSRSVSDVPLPPHLRT